MGPRSLLLTGTPWKRPQRSVDELRVGLQCGVWRPVPATYEIPLHLLYQRHRHPKPQPPMVFPRQLIPRVLRDRSCKPTNQEAASVSPTICQPEDHVLRHAQVDPSFVLRVAHENDAIPVAGHLSLGVV